MKSVCDKCYLNAKFLHKDLPFGCFASWCDLNENEAPKVLDFEAMKREHNNWIKNHPGWKGKPHMRYWYYCRDNEEFEKFIKLHPDVEHRPNDSWTDMYDIITLS